MLGNSTDVHAFAAKRVDLRVTTLIPTLDSTLRDGNGGWRWLRFGPVFGRALLMETRQHAHGHALQRVSQIVDDVPAIRHLHRTGCSAGRGAGIDAVSVSADDVDAGVVAQPFNQGVGRRILEEIKDVMRVGVDQDSVESKVKIFPRSLSTWVVDWHVEIMVANLRLLDSRWPAG